jgi:hypothetical protein
VQPGRVTQTQEEIEHLRLEYAALVRLCDASLGRVLDAMDRYALWEDTMLIVGTDHGYLLSEHGYWGKNVMPLYAELAKTPLFIWDPRVRIGSTECDALTQWIDLAPTLLRYFHVPVPATMQGRDLFPAYHEGRKLREAAIFGYHGAHVNCTEGRYVYMRAPVTADNTPLFDYTLMPCHMHAMYSPEELQNIELAEPFSFTQGCRTLKIPAKSNIRSHEMGTLLFDLQTDPGQLNPIRDAELERRIQTLMVRLMRECDAPAEQFVRLGLTHIP